MLNNKRDIVMATRNKTTFRSAVRWSKPELSVSSKDEMSDNLTIDDLILGEEDNSKEIDCDTKVIYEFN